MEIENPGRAAEDCRNLGGTSARLSGIGRWVGLSLRAGGRSASEQALRSDQESSVPAPVPRRPQAVLALTTSSTSRLGLERAPSLLPRPSPIQEELGVACVLRPPAAF